MDNKYILARKLRKNLTPQERKIWNLLKNHQFHGLEFRRQHPIGDYVVDFVCRKQKLIIEIDGGQHNFEENKIYDIERSSYLNKLEFKVLRFWNNDIDGNIDGVFEIIENHLQ